MIPAIVFLPTMILIDNRELSKALGSPSRQLQYIWRRRDGFPKSVARSGDLRFTNTADVAAWLIAKNHQVKWI